MHREIRQVIIKDTCGKTIFHILIKAGDKTTAKSIKC